MRKQIGSSIKIDEYGRLVLPEEILARLGLYPGGSASIEVTDEGVWISNPAGYIKQVYVEVTNNCNLECRMCMRKVWDEPPGWMESDTFDRILDGIKSISPLPTIFFGGYGEPLAHPRIDQMIQKACDAGAEVEIITNGILLNAEKAAFLVEAVVKRIWVSIDGATPHHYADVRMGDALPQVIDNLTRLQEIRAKSKWHFPRLGIAFVAMKRNLQELTAVIELGHQLGADKISVSNVLAHTDELREEILFTSSLRDADRQPSRWAMEISLPRMDWAEQTSQVLSQLFHGNHALRIAGQDITFGITQCPFVTKASLSVRWDGSVSPCLPLLHTHTAFLSTTQRTAHSHSFGNINHQALLDIWNAPEFLAFRRRVQQFDFSPCAFCNSCSMSESNQVDCFGNDPPTCGGCLWAQGFIQCP